MGARTGADYLEGLRDGRVIWLDGARVDDVTRDSRLSRTAASIAALYDRQHQPDVRPHALHTSPTSGAPVGLAFLQPRSVDDLVRRRTAFKVWADCSGGMFGRSPDFMSTLVTAFAAARDYFASAGPQFGDNIAAFYLECRERDLCLTHALSRPVSEEAAALRIVGESDAGVVVSGSRALATLAPFADEIMIFPGPSPRRLEQEGDGQHAIAFCAPVASRGLTFFCREGFGYGAASVDHPLGARFDEQDAVAVFEDVCVPWERVFIHRRPELANLLWSETRAFNHGAHQFLTKNLAKAEFVLGVASLIGQATGADQHLHVQAMLGEIVDSIETVRAFIRAAEADAVPGPGGTVVPDPETIDAARDYFPVVYPRLVEILQVIGASGHIAHVPDSTASGSAAALVDAHYRTKNLNGRDRVRLFKLAWDVACSGFAGRQVLYERFFDGDPFRKRASRYVNYQRAEKCRQRVQEFLARAAMTPDSGALCEESDERVRTGPAV